jgi:hypothetical protein
MGHPPAVDPGAAEQTTAGAASVETVGRGSRSVAAPAAARSPVGGSTADGMGSRRNEACRRKQVQQRL